MSVIRLISMAALLVSSINAQLSQTTQYGPSSFCQGYSPGGGDLCITIPAGCYVVPSEYNVVPDLTCSTARGTQSSTIAISITSSGRPNSPPSSRLSTATLSTGKPRSTSSSQQAAPTTSSSNSGGTSSASWTTMSQSVTTTRPASSKNGVSSASVTATQSSSLPAAVTKAAGRVDDAQNSAKAFKDDPTPDTKDSVQKAINDAKNAAQEAKDAINPQDTDFDELRSKIDELLQDLTEAAETVTKEEALAEIAAAVGPELATAAVAAAAAEELEKEDKNKPSDKPSKSASATKSTSLSSASTSSATSSASPSSSACPFCISCADTALPADGPTDNDEGTVDVPGGGSNMTSSRRRRSAKDANLFRRAQDRKRANLCGKAYRSQPYTTGATGNNFRSFGYRYASSTATCSWTFNFVTGNAGVAPGPTKSGAYQTEHVFEAQLIATFLSAIANKQNPAGAFCAVNGLYSRFIARTGAFPGRPSGVFTGGSPIAELVDNLSSDTRMIGNPPESEMTFLDQDLNALKSAVFAQDTARFNFEPQANAILAKVTRFAMLRAYLTHPDIVAIWKATSARMYATLAKVDTESAAAMNSLFSWAAEYKSWESEFLFQQGALVESALDTAIGKAKAQIRGNTAIGSQQLRDKFIAIIDTRTGHGGPAWPSDWLDIEDALQM